MAKSKEHLYKITFINQESVYEIHALRVCESEIFSGFIEVEDFVFDKNAALVVDPSEERLKLEFAEVKCCYIPVYSVLRIDEVEKKGSSKIKTLKKGTANVSMFPGMRLISSDDKE